MLINWRECVLIAFALVFFPSYVTAQPFKYAYKGLSRNIKEIVCNVSCAIFLIGAVTSYFDTRQAITAFIGLSSLFGLLLSEDVT